MTQEFSITNIKEIYLNNCYKIHNNNALVLILTGEELVKFTDKASYLDWVKSWKIFYKDLAGKQRQLRIELSKPHIDIDSVAYKMGERQINKLWLTILLEARKAGKRLSWQQKQQLQVK